MEQLDKDEKGVDVEFAIVPSEVILSSDEEESSDDDDEMDEDERRIFDLINLKV